MMFRAAVLAITLSLTSAGIAPELNVAVSSGSNNDFTGALAPSVKWSTEGNVAGTDYEVRRHDEAIVDSIRLFLSSFEHHNMILTLTSFSTGRSRPRCQRTRTI